LKQSVFTYRYALQQQEREQYWRRESCNSYHHPSYSS